MKSFNTAGNRLTVEILANPAIMRDTFSLGNDVYDDDIYDDYEEVDSVIRPISVSELEEMFSIEEEDTDEYDAYIEEEEDDEFDA